MSSDVVVLQKMHWNLRNHMDAFTAFIDGSNDGIHYLLSVRLLLQVIWFLFNGLVAVLRDEVTEWLGWSWDYTFLWQILLHVIFRVVVGHLILLLLSPLSSGWLLLNRHHVGVRALRQGNVWGARLNRACAIKSLEWVNAVKWNFNWLILLKLRAFRRISDLSVPSLPSDCFRLIVDHLFLQLLDASVFDFRSLRASQWCLVRNWGIYHRFFDLTVYLGHCIVWIESGKIMRHCWANIVLRLVPWVRIIFFPIFGSHYPMLASWRLYLLGVFLVSFGLLNLLQFLRSSLMWGILGSRALWRCCHRAIAWGLFLLLDWLSTWLLS